MKKFYLFFAIIFSVNSLCAADIESLKETNNALCKVNKGILQISNQANIDRYNWSQRCVDFIRASVDFGNDYSNLGTNATLSLHTACLFNYLYNDALTQYTPLKRYSLSAALFALQLLSFQQNSSSQIKNGDKRKYPSHYIMRLLPNKKGIFYNKSDISDTEVNTIKANLDFERLFSYSLIALTLPTHLKNINFLPLYSGMTHYFFTQYTFRSNESLCMYTSTMKEVYRKLNDTYNLQPTAINLSHHAIKLGLEIGGCYLLSRMNSHKGTNALFLGAITLSCLSRLQAIRNNFYTSAILQAMDDYNTKMPHQSDYSLLAFRTNKNEEKNHQHRVINACDDWLEKYQNHLVAAGIGAAYLTCWYKGKKNVLPFDTQVAKGFDTIAFHIVNPAAAKISANLVKPLCTVVKGSLQKAGTHIGSAFSCVDNLLERKLL